LCNNDIDLGPHELGRNFGHALIAALRPAILNRDGVSLGPTQLAQPLRKGGNPWSGGGRRAGAQESDGWRLARLRPCRQRPRRRRAAEQRDELAPS
jgi:hypothetical protein